MAASSDDPKFAEPETPSSSSWKDRIVYPTLVAGIVGAGAGLLSKHRRVVGLPTSSATYAANFAIVTAFYRGAREYVGISRKTGPDDLLNSAIAGFGTGAILGRLYGGPVAAVRYSILFTVAGTTMDYATVRLQPVLKSYKESMLGSDDDPEKKDGWLKLPDWSPIKVLDEEALAAKQRENQLYAQRALGNLSKEES